MRFARFFLATLVVLCATRVNAADKPNILIIVADDMGWHDVPWHGGNYAMPNLDRLARQGMRLESHYVHPMCSPTRAALLSGRYASRFGCVGAQNERVYPFDTITLASALKSAGYTTALVGKWHLGSLPEWGPSKFGFDNSYGSFAGGVGPYDHRYKVGPFTETWHRNGQRIQEQGHVTDLIAREAVAFVRREHTSPFFLYLPFTAIHIPMTEPQSWIDKNAHLSDPSARLRAACATHMDDAVGQVLTALEETHQRDNTLVLFFGDNGAHNLLRNNDPKYPNPQQYPSYEVGNDNGPLRGYKSSLYEGGIRTAAFLTWPARLRHGTTSAPMHACDWMPTLTKLVGYQPPRDLRWDGIDLWPQLTGESTPDEPRTLYSMASNRRSQMVRRGPWKLIVKANGEPELFNLKNDQSEQQNVAAEHPKLVADLKQRLTDVAARDNDSLANPRQP